MNAGWIQVARRMVPIQDGKIEGAKPERVVYFQAPDDSMRAMRIEKGDLVLVVPQALPVDGAIMLVEYGAHRCLRRIRLLGDSKFCCKVETGNWMLRLCTSMNSSWSAVPFALKLHCNIEM